MYIFKSNFWSRLQKLVGASILKTLFQLLRMKITHFERKNPKICMGNTNHLFFKPLTIEIILVFYQTTCVPLPIGPRRKPLDKSRRGDDTDIGMIYTEGLVLLTLGDDRVCVKRSHGIELRDRVVEHWRRNAMFAIGPNYITENRRVTILKSTYKAKFCKIELCIQFYILQTAGNRYP